MLSLAERKLLEKLADAGKPTELGAEDLMRDGGDHAARPPRALGISNCV